MRRLKIYWFAVRLESPERQASVPHCARCFAQPVGLGKLARFLTAVNRCKEDKPWQGGRVSQGCIIRASSSLYIPVYIVSRSDLSRGDTWQ